MTDRVDEIIQRLLQGQRVDPEELRDVLETPAGIQRLRAVFETQDLFEESNLEGNEANERPIPFSLQQMTDFLKTGTLGDEENDRKAQKVIDHYFPKPEDPPETGLPRE